jgi:hypothetical protein
MVDKGPTAVTVVAEKVMVTVRAATRCPSSRRSRMSCSAAEASYLSSSHQAVTQLGIVSGFWLMCTFAGTTIIFTLVTMIT